MTLPIDAAERKALPLFSGVLAYFPAALAEVARLSAKGNDQHNPGAALHWDRAKSGDEADALVRHLLEHGTIDTDGVRHSAKVAWRALALLQKELEAAGAPLARGAREEPKELSEEAKRAIDEMDDYLRELPNLLDAYYGAQSASVTPSEDPSFEALAAKHSVTLCPHCAKVTGTKSG